MADTLDHDEDDLDLLEDEEDQDIEVDEDDDTPADTDGEPKTPAEQARDNQEKAWLKSIRSGDKKLEDMPKNLDWLRNRIEPKLKKEQEVDADEDEIDRRVKKVLRTERESEDLDLLLDDLEETATQEQLARFKEEYEELVGDGVSPLRATITARRLIGLVDRETAIIERRRQGRKLMPNAGKRRETVSKDKMTEIEKKLGEDLPPGFKA